MKLAIVGSRKFTKLDAVRSFVAGLPAGTVIISGGAEGVDRVAAEAGRARGLQVEVIRPDYKKYHAAFAPKARNRQIAEACDAMIAFWDGVSGGTANVVTWAAFYGKVITVLTPEGGDHVQPAESR